MMSEHYKSLDKIHAERYLKKIECIGYEDPYCMSDFSNEIAELPPVLYPDIVNYLVFTRSAFSMEQLKAYKGLESYKAASSGWVRELHSKRIGDHIVVLGKVLHSQRLNEKPLNPWIICQSSGTVASAHCDCVAGLGETCTHVSALLFSIDNVVRPSSSIESKSVTDVKAYWTAPSCKPSAPSKVFDIDFMNLNINKSQLEDSTIPVQLGTEDSTSSQEDIVKFLQTLKDTTRRGCALHSIVSPFNQEIEQDLSIRSKYYLSSSLYKAEHELKKLEELIEIGESLSLEMSYEECKKIAEATKAQKKSQEWFLYRSGRITASNFKRACRTMLDKPSVSLIRTICYPTKFNFTSKQTAYGCDHEKDALRHYERMMLDKHTNFDIETSGLVINPTYPYLGASPDGLSNCDCHGIGCVEVKCPYCAKDTGIEELMEMKNTYLEIKSGNVSLKQDHQYYYQVQMQMALCGLTFCDFVVWSPKDIFIERIAFNEQFWLSESQKAKNFFFRVLMPELLGKYFTKNLEVEGLSSSQPEDDWQLLQAIGDSETIEEITIIYED